MIPEEKRKKTKRFYRRAVSFLFPDRCCFCGRVIHFEEEICPECRKSADIIRGEKCRMCGKSKTDCNCKGRARYYSAITAPYNYTGVVKRGIHLWKFSDARESVEYFGKAVAYTVKQDFPEKQFDFICFIPQTAKEPENRGFNQSEKLAAEVAKCLKIPVCPVLRKNTETQRQHDIPWYRRSGNIFGVFDCDKNIELTGKSILLTDDVKTSGATLNECAKMLRLSGAEEVICAVIAIA